VLGPDGYSIELDGVSPITVFPGRRLELAGADCYRMAAGRMK